MTFNPADVKRYNTEEVLVWLKWSEINALCRAARKQAECDDSTPALMSGMKKLKIECDRWDREHGLIGDEE